MVVFNGIGRWGGEIGRYIDGRGKGREWRRNEELDERLK